MFVISGLLWRLGLSIQLSYMVWMPVGLIVLFAGFASCTTCFPTTVATRRPHCASDCFMSLRCWRWQRGRVT